MAFESTLEMKNDIALITLVGELDASVAQTFRESIEQAATNKARKLVLQLAHTGLAPWFGPHVFSGHELPRSKPFPDVYLAAAAALGAAPRRCLVIEDTPTGIQAGVAAGATVWAYCPRPDEADALIAAGAHALFDSMAGLPALWQAGRAPRSA